MRYYLLTGLNFKALGRIWVEFQSIWKNLEEFVTLVRMATADENGVEILYEPIHCGKEY